MESGKLAIIGGGKLGSALAEGMIRAGLIAEYRIHITRRNAELLKPLADKGLITGSDNIAAVKDASIVFLAVKPWQVEEVLGSLVDSLARSEEHTSELQSRENLVCRLLLEKKKQEL